MKQQSDWMKGLLWAEDYVEKYDLSFLRYYVEVVLINNLDCEFTQGIWDYLKHYEERLSENY